jgi:hypothetical protein
MIQGGLGIAGRTRPSASIPSGVRTVSQIHDKAVGLQTHTRTLEAELHDLQGSMTYQMVVDEGRISGRSLSRLAPALATLEELRPGFEALGELLEEVSAGAPGEEPGLEWLLFGPSIELAGRRLTAAELLRGVEDAIRAASGVLTAIDEAWRDALPRLANCEGEVRALREQAQRLGLASLTEDLGRMQAHADWLRSQVRIDPLGVAESLAGELAPALEEARHGLTEERQQQQAIAVDLLHARSCLAELEDLHAQVVAESRRVRMRILDPWELIAPPDPAYLSGQPMGLEPWLARLETLHRRGVVRPIRRGLESWLKVADASMVREREVLVGNRALLEQRQDQGRLRVLTFPENGEA